jgi:hypothetical protein
LFSLGDIGGTLQDIVDTQTLQTQYHAFDLKVRDSSDDPLYIPLTFKKTQDLLISKKKSYFTERNEDFLTETGLVKKIRSHDAFLRPYLVSQCRYDWWQGSEGTTTPLRYEISYRTYLFVTEGQMRVQLVPPKYTKFLHAVEDYELFEFRSPVSLVDPLPEYKEDVDKIKSLDITLYPGQILFLPAYWWYSVTFGSNTSVGSNTSALVFQYKTFMNVISLLPYYALYAMQMQNIQRKTVQERKREEIPSIEKKNRKTKKDKTI